jgi:hypothetical protein
MKIECKIQTYVAISLFVLFFQVYLPFKALADSDSADTNFDYNVVNTVAIGIYNESAVNSSSPLLSGGTPIASKFSVTDQSVIANDILQETDEAPFEEDFYINGVVYSNVLQVNSFTLTPGQAGASADTMRLSQSSDYIDLKLSGTAGISGQTVSLSTSAPVDLTSAQFDSNTALAPFHIGCDVDEATVDVSDQAGTYTGTLTFSITSP